MPIPRDDYISGLRKLADILEAHPEIELPSDGRVLPLSFCTFDDSAREQLAAVVRHFPGPLTKDYSDQYFRLSGKLAGLKLQWTYWRENVCVKRVVGTETVTEIVPDPDHVRVAPLVEVTTERELVEWECPPILADDREPVVTAEVSEA